MANVGSGASGNTLIGNGNGSGPRYAAIGTNSGLTTHGVVVSEGNGAFVSKTPSATVGIPLVSNGSSADPSFTTAVVEGGGTGQNSFPLHSILIGAFTSPIGSLSPGTSGTLVQSLGASSDPQYTNAAYPSVSGASGNVITSNGTDFVSISNSYLTVLNKQIFTSSGTYTPTSGMKYCIVECVGGGGGGGGVAATSAVQVAASGGGAGSAYARSLFNAGTIGVSQTVTVGAGGTAGTTTPSSGGAGGNSLLGVLIQGSGGNGGSLCNANSTFTAVGGGAGTVTSLGDVTGSGAPGGASFCQFNATPVSIGGVGGSSIFGAGGVQRIQLATGSTPGAKGLIYGGGGSGAVGTNGTANTGGAGGDGIVVITEFI